MVYAPVRSTIPSLKLGDYLSVQAHKPCSVSHFFALSTSFTKLYHTVCMYLYESISQMLPLIWLNAKPEVIWNL